MSRLVLVALLLLSACGDAGTAPDSATPDVMVPAFAAVPNPSFQPFAFTVTNCAEPVDVSGTFHEASRISGSGGNQHVRFHINAKGTGVGQLTGARYQWNDRLFDNTNIAVNGATSFVLNDITRLIGQGGAPNAKVHVLVKVTVNAKGVITVDRDHVRATCR
jgi:hypothetical protein